MPTSDGAVKYRTLQWPINSHKRALMQYSPLLLPLKQPYESDNLLNLRKECCITQAIKAAYNTF
jgi:hypothetical protein